MKNVFFETQIRVRYGETDQMGVVYYGNYALYLEAGRTEWLRKFGLSYKSMEENGIMLPVVSMSINYKKSASYDEIINVKTQLKKTPTVKIPKRILMVKLVPKNIKLTPACFHFL
mgnify:CR=1 FL=1